MTDFEKIDRYEIKHPLGKGGMATVYLAHDPHFARDVAIKLLPREFLHDDKFLARFENEAKFIASLEHPAIVPVHDYGHYDGQPYIVMRYMSGGSLADKLKQGPLSGTAIFNIISRIAEALYEAHKRGYIHRDLKPANILFDDADRAYLADFGIAKMAESTANLTGTGLVGTPAYMSPEQWDGDQKLDGRADVYALGVILYEMLAGENPFKADTPIKLMKKHVLDPIPDIRQERADLSLAIKNVTDTALAKDRDDRFSTPLELSSSLNEALKEGIAAAETPPPPQTPPPQTPPPQTPVQQTPPQQKPLKQKQPPPTPPPAADETHDTPPALIQPPKPARKARQPGAFDWRWLFVGILLSVVIFGGGYFLWTNVLADLDFSSSQPDTSSRSDRDEDEPEEEDPTITPTQTNTPTNTPIPLPQDGDAITAEKDGMTLLYVSAGEFEMGSEDGRDTEKPVHTVYLDAYMIDQTEVTNAMYKLCVAAGVCDVPSTATNYNDAAYADHPVVYVSWNDADAYCTWAGRRLPTEAEWEKAARGTDGRIRPWGEGINGTLANYGSNVRDTTPVGTYPAGASPYGALDMAGNAYEWVADWYAKDYYESSPLKNPTGPKSGTDHVLRDVSWADRVESVRSAGRLSISPTHTDSYIGFRCAVPTTNEAEVVADADDGQVIPTSIPTSKPTSIPTATQSASQLIDEFGHEMAIIPAGEFTMGSEDGDDNEKPAHTVYLDAYYIDIYEVTNAQYANCVEAGACGQPEGPYYTDPLYADHPVTFVRWGDGQTYCEWRDANLPTEAQWEKAARGTDGRTYPWGEEVGAEYANYAGNVGGSAPVGSYPDGASPYGVQDMAGNVWEWTGDWFGKDYYSSSPYENPTGPESAEYRVVRGGVFTLSESFLQTYYRTGDTMIRADKYFGFRCAADIDIESNGDTTNDSVAETNPTATPIIPATIAEKDGMTQLYIPAGEFEMGSEDGREDEKPVHAVYLDAFWIDQTEVTNAMYKLCVAAGVCAAPSTTTGYDDAAYANHPVVFVSWNDANAYCTWAGRRLPTDAEWEKAARGTDGRTYPWGEGIDETLANYDRNVNDTTPVGTYPTGASPYGALDMAGNAYEWAADWYAEDYYVSPPLENPTGPKSGTTRVLRDVSWADSFSSLRAASRLDLDPAYTDKYVGFRCAASP